MTIQTTPVTRPKNSMDNMIKGLGGTEENTLKNSVTNTGFMQPTQKANVLDFNEFKTDVDKVRQEYGFDEDKALNTVINYYKEKGLTVRGYEDTFIKKPYSKDDVIYGTDIEDEDVEGWDFGLDTSEFLMDLGKGLKIESKFDIDRKENETLLGAFKNSGKHLLNTLRFAGNIPGDSIEFIGEMLGLTSNVVGTARSIKDISVGLADKMGLTEGTEEQRAMIDALNQAIKENFGTAEDALETIQQNPLDTFMVIWGGTAGAKQTIKHTKYGKTAKGKQLIAKLDAMQKGIDPFMIIGAELKLGKKLFYDVPANLAKRGYVKATGVNWESVQNIVKRPELFKQAEKGKLTREGVAKGVVDAIDEGRASVSRTGREYAKVHKQTASNPTILAERLKTKVKAYLAKKGITIEKNGKLNFANSSIGAKDNMTAIQKAYNAIMERTDFSNGKAWLGLRHKVSDTINWQSGATSRGKAIVKGMRKYIDDITKNEFKGLKELDAKYAPVRQQFDDLNKIIRNKDGSLKPNYISKIANITGKGKEVLLDKLRKIDPDLDAKVNAVKALEDVELAKNLKVGDYMKNATLGMGGIFGGVTGLVGAYVATHPSTLIAILKAYTTARGFKNAVFETIVDKIRKGIKLNKSEAVVVKEAIKAEVKTEKAKPKKVTEKSKAEQAFEDELGFKKVGATKSAKLSTKGFINPQAIADDVAKLGKKATPEQLNQLAKKIVVGLDVAKDKIKEVYRIVREWIQKEWEGLKPKIEDLVDTIADKTGARLKLFGGEGALKAPLSQKQKAINMEKAGKSTKEIWQKTGWTRGVDKKWKFEIDDTSAKILSLENRALIEADVKLMASKNKVASAMKLEELLDHPQLYKNYPELRDVNVIIDDLGKGTKGTYIAKDNLIAIDKAFFDKVYLKEIGLDELKSVLLHEIQHNIQKIEGFARGGFVTKGTGARLIEIEIKGLKQQREALEASKLGQARKADLDKLGKEFNKRLDDGKISTQDLTKWYEGELKKLRVKHKEYWKKNDAITGKIGPLLDELKSLDDVAYAKYKALAGEVEARNVQARLKLTSEGKKAISPEETMDLAPEAQIVKFRDEVAMSTLRKERKIYHGTPYVFDDFKDRITFFSDKYKFARDYADTKSFDFALDADIVVKQRYIPKGTNIFDSLNPRDMAKIIDDIPENPQLGGGAGLFGRDLSKTEFVEKLQGINKYKVPAKILDKPRKGKVVEIEGYGWDSGKWEIKSVTKDKIVAKKFRIKETQKENLDRYNALQKFYKNEEGIKALQNFQARLEKYAKSKGKEIRAAHGGDMFADGYILYKPVRNYYKQETFPRTEYGIEKSRNIDWQLFEGDLLPIIAKKGFDGIKMSEQGEVTYAIFNPNKTLTKTSATTKVEKLTDVEKKWLNVDEYTFKDQYEFINSYGSEKAKASMEKIKKLRKDKVGKSIEEMTKQEAEAEINKLLENYSVNAQKRIEDIELYHGLLEVYRGGSKGGKFSYYTTSYDGAKTYAGGDKVYTRNMQMKNPLDLTNFKLFQKYDDMYDLGPRSRPNYENYQKMFRDLENQGYDGYIGQSTSIEGARGFDIIEYVPFK